MRLTFTSNADTRNNRGLNFETDNYYVHYVYQILFTLKYHDWGGFTEIPVVVEALQ